MPPDPEEQPTSASSEGIPDRPAGDPTAGSGDIEDGRTPPLAELPAQDFWDALYERRSIRRFRPDPVARELVDQVMHAGIWAPSSCNYQMWDLVAVDDPEINADLAALSSQMGNAPVNIVVAYGRGFSEENAANIQSASALIQNMSLAAQVLGLGTFWITQTGDAEKVRARVLNGLRHNKPRAWETRALLESLEAHVPAADQDSGNRWLDVLPCTGILTERVARERRGYTFEVAERSPEVAGWCAKRVKPNAVTRGWPTTSAGMDAPEDGAYDVVSCLFRLEGLGAEERARLITDMARWLKPGGTLWIAFVSKRSRRPKSMDRCEQLAWWPAARWAAKPRRRPRNSRSARATSVRAPGDSCAGSAACSDGSSTSLV